MKAFVRAALLPALLCCVQLSLAQPAPVPAAPRAPEIQAPQPIPFRKSDDSGELIVKVALGLGIALAAGVGVLFVLRRYLVQIQRAPGRRLRVIETVRLTPKSALFLVEVDGQTLLIGQQGETLAMLAQPPSASEASTTQPGVTHG